MFAHVYGQDSVTDLLRQEITNHDLPQALLFFGERYSGRMAAALETARILHCSMGGVPACKCSSCSSSRRLVNPYTLVFANRDLLQIIKAAAAGYAQARNRAAALLVEQSCRLLLKRFDSVWDLQLKDQKGQLVDAKELLEEFISRDDRFTDGQDQSLEDLIGLAGKLSEGIKSLNIPVHSIRSMQAWLATKPKDQQAVIILEGLEHFAEASKHALLKFLEEPPPKVTAILISEGKGRILPTILSRVRRYPFLTRNFHDQSQVISDVFFQDPESYDSLRTFFLSHGGIDCRQLREEMQYVLEGLFAFREYDHDRFIHLLKQIDEQNAGHHALMELQEAVKECREQQRIDSDVEFQGWKVINEACRLLSGTNQRQSMIIESCCYQLAEMYQHTR